MIKVIDKNQIDKYLEEIVDLRIKLNDMHVACVDDVFKDNIVEDTRKDTIKAVNNPDCDIVIMEVDSKVMAYALVNYEKTIETFDKKSRKLYYIQEIMISDTYQHQGLGKKMIEFLKKDAFQKGYKRIELDVWNFNQNAVNFYKKVGFREVQLIMSAELIDE